MQETWVWSQIQEDPTYRGITKLVSHNIEPVLWSPGTTTAETRVPRACALQQEKAKHHN